MRIRFLLGVTCALASLILAGCTNEAASPEHATFLSVKPVDPGEDTNGTSPKIHTNVTELEYRIPPLARAVRTADSGGEGEIRDPQEIEATWDYVDQKLGRAERGLVQLDVDGRAFWLVAIG